MNIRDVSVLALWHLHHASGGQLARVVITFMQRGLQVHLHASRTSGGTLSIIILGRDGEGTGHAYQEVTLTDVDSHVEWAWNDVRLDDVLESARVSLAKADAALDALKRGEPLPPLRQGPRGAS